MFASSSRSLLRILVTKETNHVISYDDTYTEIYIEIHKDIDGILSNSDWSRIKTQRLCSGQVLKLFEKKLRISTRKN
jgi:hypothetical protein